MSTDIQKDIQNNGENVGQSRNLNRELFRLLRQYGEGDIEEYKRRKGELSDYWKYLLIGLLKTDISYKEKHDREVELARDVRKCRILEYLSQCTVTKCVNLGGYPGTFFELRLGNKKAPKYYYTWNIPTTTRQYKRYLEEGKLPKEIEKYLITEEEICDLLSEINEYMKLRRVNNDGDIDYKTALTGGKNKILAGEYLIEIAPHFYRRTITKEGRFWENENFRGSRFTSDDGKSYNLLLSLPKEFVESDGFKDACVDGSDIF